MITEENVKHHGDKYPLFKVDRIIRWLNDRPGRWQFYKSVSEANRARRNEPAKKERK